MPTDELSDLFSLEPAMGLDVTRPLDPPRSTLPVRLTDAGDRNDRDIVGGGTGNLVSVQGGDESNAPETEPDAVGRGWVTPPGGTRVEALFVLAGSSLGIGRTERVVAPVWLDLADLVNLDAIGDPTDDGLTEVEISMADGTVIGAGWTEAFCEAVVAVLTAESERPGVPDAADVAGVPAPSGPDVRFDEVVPTDVDRVADPVVPVSPSAASDPSTGVFSAQPVVRNRSRRNGTHTPAAIDADTPAASDADTTDVAAATDLDDVTEAPGGPPTLTVVPPIEAPHGDSVAPEPVPPVEEVPSDTSANAPMFGVGTGPSPSASGPTESSAPAPTTGTAGRTGALELEDVVYIGGYPGQTRRRKKCTAVLTHEGLEVAGPSDLRFRIAWDEVKTVEAQNSDEARFRMNTKIHRDSSALVVECEQNVTILLEARDCPTIPLRSAITQLLVDLPVVVV